MPLLTRLKGIELQPRDALLLQGLLDSRLMTLKHVAALFFSDSREAAKKRLQKLRGAGWIVQRPRRPQDPAIYILGRAGYLHLRQAGLVDDAAAGGWATIQKAQRIGDLMLKHELAVIDAKAALVCAAKNQPNLELITLSTSPDRHAFRAVEAVMGAGGFMRFKSVRAKPDGFMQLRVGESIDHFFFLEVDRGTEALRRLLQKIAHYNQYYRSGRFALRFGHARVSYKQCPFRVLFTFMTTERRNNVAAKLLESKSPIKSQVWLTTLTELTSDPLGAIWIRPIDYQMAVSGTAFDLGGKDPSAIYRRQPGREDWVEIHTHKLTLFEDQKKSDPHGNRSEAEASS